MIRKAIVTGATGMIGRALIQELVSHNIQVLALCNPYSSRLQAVREEKKIKRLLVPLDELQSVYSKETYDVCFHLAWQATEGEARNQVDIQMNNISYTLAAVQMAKRLGCHTFIGGGSQAEYGRTHMKLNDLTPTNPENAYGIAKYSAGKLSDLLAQQLGMRHIWARILSVYGPGDGKNTLIMSMISQLIKGEVPALTLGEQMWDYLYCHDAARALYLLANNRKTKGIYCIGSGEVKPLKEYMYQIRDAINPQLELKLGAKPYSTHQVMYLCADITPLKRDIGFKPQVSFELGIQHTIGYYKRMIEEKREV